MTKPQDRQEFTVGHITFRTIVCPRGGASFALIAGDALHPVDRKPLFTGHVYRGMGSELRRLAHHFDDLEAGLAADEGADL